MGKSKNIYGFTLIELLVVIAVLGVIAAGVFTVINPLKRINQANDAKVKNDVGQMAEAAQSFSTANSFGSYPNNKNLLTQRGDLKTLPTAPSGYSDYNLLSYPNGTGGTTQCDPDYKDLVCTKIVIYGQIKEPKTAGNTLWCWRSDTNEVKEDTTCIVP